MWLEEVPFFDSKHQLIWVFWRRVLHTCHHRTQLTVYLRLLNKPVPSVYGPTTDPTWEGADPTTPVAAAGRKKTLRRKLSQLSSFYEKRPTSLVGRYASFHI